MAALFNENQWRTLRRLYIADRKGIAASGAGYVRAGAWDALRYLRDYDPPLVREQFDTSGDFQGQYRVVITGAGIRFYEQNQRLYDAFYPS